MENVAFSSWISESVAFNKSDEKINSVIDFKHAEDHEARGDEAERDAMDVEGSGREAAEGEEAIAILDISRKIVQVCSWDGDKESKVCVIKCLASLLSPEGK